MVWDGDRVGPELDPEPRAGKLIPGWSIDQLPCPSSAALAVPQQAILAPEG